MQLIFEMGDEGNVDRVRAAANKNLGLRVSVFEELGNSRLLFQMF